eukprot:CAMPEP_0173070722 /NCGR_PEP_ID=MMETSP1102-20130122/8795_1 /TAXON_ID=49646 /ORGANISM="Geminigera sp., Strain Caron Lab Isolate" /LENGTH=148 /DNA_ID=CAMNT_0013939063 /DNA_START=133 /DNA_END=579 /DNA_ORIENTATION=-
MGNALQSCCASDHPGKDNAFRSMHDAKSSGPNASKSNLPDDWTDTSFDHTAGDSSLMDESIGPGGMKGGPSFRTMSKQDYLLLYDGIHTLLKERKIGKEQENELYELIGQQDKRLAAAYVKYKDTGQVDALVEPLSRKSALIDSKRSL